MKRCNIWYGNRRQHKCRRLAGHSGPHAVRPWVPELILILAADKRKKRK